MSTPANIRKFLEDSGITPASVDIEAGCLAFTEEMRKGLGGQKSSLEMIPSYIGGGLKPKPGEPVIAIDAGGTNLRVCVVRFAPDGKPEMEGFALHPMPGTQGRVSRDEFFGLIAGYLKPLIGKASKIGFCFSYSTEIEPDGDGRLLAFSKQVQADGVEGSLIGRGLLDAVERAGLPGGQSVVLLNDTVATLLAGQANGAGKPYGSYIGFILGTGTNTCYIERNAEIRKRPGLDPRGNMIVNMESGAYALAPRGAIDLRLDTQTVNPGIQTFEKMISGAYFGDLALTALKAAAEEGLFSSAYARAIQSLGSFSPKDVNEFLANPFGTGKLAQCCAADADRTAAFYILDALFERSAKLVAINLISVVQKTGEGSDPCRPICITVEGTLFHKSPVFRKKLDYYLKQHLEDRLGLHCEFVYAENASLLGAAIAGLSR